MEETHKMIKELRSDVTAHFASLGGILSGVKGSMSEEQTRKCA